MKLTPASRGRPADVRFDEIVNDAARVLTSRTDFADEISRLWRISQKHFVQIGRYLNQAKELLDHGEFEEMIARDLPFTPAIGRQLRTAALFVDGGDVPPEQLPDGYSTVYQIATLPPEVRQAAFAAGVIHPRVTRERIQALKNETKPKTDDRTLQKLIAERDRLEAKLAKVNAEIAALTTSS